MGQWEIQRYRGTDLKQSSFLKDQVNDVIRSYYECTVSLLGREFSHCNTMYCAYEKDKLVGFAMFAYEMLLIEDNKEVPSLYVGLVGTRDGFQNRGIPFASCSEVAARVGRCETFDLHRATRSA